MGEPFLAPIRDEPCSQPHREAEERPSHAQHRTAFHIAVTGDKTSGGVLLRVDPFGTDVCLVFLEQTLDSVPRIDKRRPCIFDKALWRHLYPCRTPAGIWVASLAYHPVSEHLLLDLGGVAGAAIGE